MKYKAFKFGGLTKNEMPVGAWVSPVPKHPNRPDEPSHIDDERYLMAKRLGLNFMNCIYESIQGSEEEFFRALELAGKYNIKLMVRDEYFFYKGKENHRFTETYNKYKDKRGFGGVLVCDEPHKEYFQVLADLKAIYKQICPEKVFYVNLFPLYVFPGYMNDDGTLKTREEAGGGYGYEDYISDFIRIFRPEFLSYDYYPLKGPFPELSPWHFAQLDIIRRHSLKAGIPFWCFIAVTSWSSAVRLGTKPEIMWQLSAALACGCKGIQYFTYDTPVNGDVPEGERYSEALLDSRGKPTERYLYAKAANRHIKAVGRVLMNSSSEGIMIAGFSPVRVPPESVIESHGIIEKIAGKHILAGCFEYNRKPAYYVMNNSITEEDFADIKFIRTARYRTVIEDTASDNEGCSLRVRLPAGEGFLLYIK